jgi:spore coat polysaccharide biosynthesis protein SpsF
MHRRTIAIVQARMGSERFPGKSLAPINGTPVLEWVLRRVALAHHLDGVTVATSTNQKDDSIVDFAQNLGFPVFRGSEPDVLERMLQAARLVRAERVVRVCADNPFVDPAEIDRLIQFFEEGCWDYACNHQDRLGSRYADGFGAEILSMALFETVARLANEPRQREHVTLYIWDHEQEYRIGSPLPPDDLVAPELRFDVDRAEDLLWLESISSSMKINSPASDFVRAARKLTAAPECRQR